MCKLNYDLQPTTILEYSNNYNCLKQCYYHYGGGQYLKIEIINSELQLCHFLSLYYNVSRQKPK